MSANMSITSRVLLALVLFPAGALAAVPTITGLSPLAGPIGTKVTLTGTNLAGATAVAFDGTAGAVSASTAGSVIAVAPAAGAGTIKVTTPGGSAVSSARFTLTPSLALSLSSGRPGRIVTVTGAGFAAYQSIDLFLDTTDIALAVSNGSGVVAATVQVPLSSQPGAHWFTLDARSNHVAAQQVYTTSTPWAQISVNSQLTGYNSFENTINTGNVQQLGLLWSRAFGQYSNAEPKVEVSGVLYVADINGVIEALNATTGSLLWTGPTPSAFTSVHIASFGNLVLFQSGTTLTAYRLLCRADGGVCTPSWTQTLPVVSYADPTVFNGMLYVPGGDGLIRPYNPATGAPGTPFAAPDADTSPIISPVSFAVDGRYWYETTTTLHEVAADGSSYGSAADQGYASGVTLGFDKAFYSIGDGTVQQFFGAPFGSLGSGCAPRPVIANNLVYGGGCTAIGAFEASTGNQRWGASAAYVSSMAVANGVLYACDNARLQAFDANYGGLLWSGGYCSGNLIIANGVLYTDSARVSAYALPQMNTSLITQSRRRPPSIVSLRPDPTLRPGRTPEQGEGAP